MKIGFELNAKHFNDAMRAAINQELDRVVEEAVKETLVRVEKEVRASLGKVALGLMKNYDAQVQGREIVIRVRNEVLK